VALAREAEGVGDLVQVDGLERVVRVLVDDREEVAEQLALVLQKGARQLLADSRARELVRQSYTDVGFGERLGE
jgi:hypothetical protein